MNIYFSKLTEPTEEIVEAMNRWDNDEELIPLIRPNKDKAELERRHTITIDDLIKSMEYHQFYLIYLDDKLVGEMNYMVDPGHLYKKETGTAWIGITIGEAIARGKGVGYLAMKFIENEIKKDGHSRIELGVFEFNEQAIKLYQKLGYQEIGRIDNFTYWSGKMWTDIRMEKYL